MPIVYCYNYDCVYNNSITGECCHSMISVEAESEYGCNDYSSYLDTTEYLEEFYILVGNICDKEKRYIPKGREKRYGKKIEYNGRTFYTREKISADDRFNVTDAKTGLLVGFDKVKIKWDAFIAVADKQPAIETFPIVKKSDDGKFHLVEGGEA